MLGYSYDFSIRKKDRKIFGVFYLIYLIEGVCGGIFL